MYEYNIAYYISKPKNADFTIFMHQGETDLNVPDTI